MDAERKRISCRRCQLRKLKCTRVYPCNSCEASGNECCFRGDDTRRRPVSRVYVAALEDRLASYETKIRTLQQPQANSACLFPSGTLPQTPKVTGDTQALTPDLIFDYDGSSRRSTLVLQPNPQGHRSFYGPTSIYQKNCLTEPAKESDEDLPSLTLNAHSDIRLSGILKVDDTILNESLLMFFRHLNAECPFIDGALLLEDFTHGRHDGQFWSYPLLYAICCLGSRLSRDMHISKTTGALSQCVHELLNLSNLQNPHATVVQALLCLAFSELGAGNNTKGWMLSGMAFRMVQDLGLHQDPKFLTQDDSTINLSRDSRVRRKIYWGCYTADKLISLYFGRPISLREDDASVDPLDFEDTRCDAQEIPETPKSSSSGSSLLSNIMPSSLVLTQLAQLSRIIELMMSEVFSTKLIKLPRRELVFHRVSKLEELNLKLLQWHSTVPESLKWNQWTPTTQNLPPHLAILHCIISLNRHFIRPTPGFARKNQSREICLSSADTIMAITRQYRSQHSLATAPLILVYSLAMAATAVTFALDSTTSPEGQSSELGQHLTFLLKTLKECAKTYDVADHICERLKKGMLNKKLAQRGASDTLLADRSEITRRSSTELMNSQPTILAGMGNSASPWWNSDVLDFGQLDQEGQWGGLDIGFYEDQEGDVLSNFNWSNVFI